MTLTSSATPGPAPPKDIKAKTQSSTTYRRTSLVGDRQPSNKIAVPWNNRSQVKNIMALRITDIIIGKKRTSNTSNDSVEITNEGPTLLRPLTMAKNLVIHIIDIFKKGNIAILNTPQLCRTRIRPAWKTRSIKDFFWKWASSSEMTQTLSKSSWALSSCMWRMDGSFRPKTSTMWSKTFSRGCATRATTSH